MREALRDPEVGVVGCVGAVGVRSIAWWEGSVTWASFTHRYREHGGGDVPSLSWTKEGLPAFAHTGEVDTVDGFVLALAPWVVRNVRFDESLGLLHGYDFDFCMQVRAAGRKIVTADFRVVHHHSLELVSNRETWLAAHMRRGREVGRPDHRAERERLGAAGPAGRGRGRARAHRRRSSASSRRTPRGGGLESELADVTGSMSWRITEPLRRLNAARRARRASMIAFGCPITGPRGLRALRQAGDRRGGRGRGASVFAYRATSSIFRSYNLILDQAAALR